MPETRLELICNVTPYWLLLARENSKPCNNQSEQELGFAHSYVIRMAFPPWTPGSRLRALEPFSIECGNINTKVITLASQRGRRRSSEPIKTRSNYMWLTKSAGKREHVSHGFVFTSVWMTKWREFFKPVAERSNEKPFQNSIHNSPLRALSLVDRCV